MQLIEFSEQTMIIAKDQPEYMPLPAHMAANDPNGTVTCCWRLNWRERLRVMFGGVIWHQVLTFGTSLQPQLLTTKKPDMPKCIHDINYTPGRPPHCPHCGYEFKVLAGVPMDWEHLSKQR